MDILTESYEDYLVEHLQDPAQVEGYLNAAQEDPDPRVFQLALQDVLKARSLQSATRKDPVNMREHQHNEWKESWRDEHLKWISGFANAEGGVLHLGRNDQGVVVGLTNIAKLLEDIPNKVRDVLGILVAVNAREEAGQEYLEIAVDPYPYPISYKGQYYIRTGSTLQELKGAALDNFLLQKQGRRWDGVPVPQVSIADLSSGSLQRFRKGATQSNRLTSEILQEDDAHLIDKLHLIEGDYLKRAAVLLFHPDPERFVTGAYTKIAFFATDADILYQDEIHGDLFTQVDRILELLYTKYLKALISYAKLQRVETYPVPYEALREAVLNAVAHKDYSEGIPIQISVYNDKVMLWNPGTLPPEWTIERLFQKHSSKPYNPDIASTFFRAGMIESWGRGIEKILTSCHTAGLPSPEFRYEGSDLWVTFRFKPEYIQKISSTDPVTDLVTDPVTDPVHRLLLTIGTSSMASSEIMQQLSLKHRATFRQNYLYPALEKELIEMTLPDKPRSRLQQYRLTKAGLTLLNTLERGSP